MSSNPLPFPDRFREHPLSRRRFLQATGAALGAGLLVPPPARATHRVPPRPIAATRTIVVGGEQFVIHHFGPASGNEPSNIGDFHGLVGNSRMFGSGTGRDTKTGETVRLLYQADMGFNEGVYIGEDGRRHHGTFGFF